MLFDQILENHSVNFSLTITASLIDNFALASLDDNPVHMSQDYALEAGFKGRIFHGAGLVSIVSSVIANQLPGPGSILITIESRFLKPAYLGDEVMINVKVDKKLKITNTINLQYTAVNDDSLLIMSGKAKVLVPKDNPADK